MLVGGVVKVVKVVSDGVPNDLAFEFGLRRSRFVHANQ